MQHGDSCVAKSLDSFWTVLGQKHVAHLCGIKTFGQFGQFTPNICPTRERVFYGKLHVFQNGTLMNVIHLCTIMEHSRLMNKNTFAHKRRVGVKLSKLSKDFNPDQLGFAVLSKICPKTVQRIFIELSQRQPLTLRLGMRREG